MKARLCKGCVFRGVGFFECWLGSVFTVNAKLLSNFCCRMQVSVCSSLVLSPTFSQFQFWHQGRVFKLCYIGTTEQKGSTESAVSSSQIHTAVRAFLLLCHLPKLPSRCGTCLLPLTLCHTDRVGARKSFWKAKLILGGWPTLSSRQAW